ncbi:hypothetical protein EHF33_15915 [Deinococcus psychrotolerans]|uniref:Uncharacterized protein n=1 Tax=Deinococcus psychrotolerans TaxID=2489213 RepID=A0A3G8YJA6_9DEIO|nr:hypothetical protein [Deinococcus psychrotolerans]AZI44367.1 hypothetical protein EHF33_15915 [Deinococcus psychrotolerans]
MSRNVLIRFVRPPPVKISVSKAVTRTRQWDGEKMAAFLQEGLEIWAADKYPEFEMRVATSRQAEIRFENWKPEKKDAEELRAEIGEQIGLVMEGIEPEDYLSE